MGTRIPFKRPDGQEAQGYLARAGKAGAPGVVVIQEWWGLQDQIKGICDRLALAGYDALAPDLYGGTVVPYHDTDAANREMSSLNFLEATDQLVRGAAQFLLRSSGKVGLTGFCLGGAVTILGACRIPELSAGVCFYGLPPGSVAGPADVKVPLQGHFALRDDWCTPAAVASFEEGLGKAGKDGVFFLYDADHGFMNEQRPVHDRAHGELAWERMLAFWGEHLG
ncbi:MAG: dienelactone hydrolase family protein [Alphaproteobacteria bacterium]|nr:dienelactone hydrolase family protein [Alphaproteobacteria bacterium]